MGQQDEVLTPSYHGELCSYNGENPDYEIACDACNHYLICFPDWEAILERIDRNSRAFAPLKFSSNEELETYLRAVAGNGTITDLEKEIIKKSKGNWRKGTRQIGLPKG